MSVRIIVNIANFPKVENNHQEHVTDPKLNERLNALRREVYTRSAHQIVDRVCGNQDMIDTIQIPITTQFNRYLLEDSVQKRLGALFGLKSAYARLQIQNPGQVATMHIDALDRSYVRPLDDSLIGKAHEKEDVDTFQKDNYYAVRFLIMPEDCMPGQAFIFEKDAITDWKSGDVLCWDIPNDMHMTVNGSYWPRKLIRLDGFCTEKTYEILNQPFTQLDYLQ